MLFELSGKRYAWLGFSPTSEKLRIEVRDVWILIGFLLSCQSKELNQTILLCDGKRIFTKNLSKQSIDITIKTIGLILGRKTSTSKRRRCLFIPNKSELLSAKMRMIASSIHPISSVFLMEFSTAPSSTFLIVQRSTNERPVQVRKIVVDIQLFLLDFSSRGRKV